MFRHHLLLIYRNFIRYKSSFFINLIGLTAGLTCSLLIYLWVYDELQKDQFHHERLYQVMENEQITWGINTVEGTPGILAEALANEMPEVERGVTTSPTFWLANSKISIKDKPAIKAAGKFAGPEFFNLFSYPLVAGSADKVLRGKNSIVISDSLAMRLFQTTDVIGKTLVWRNAEVQNENHAIISGVFAAIRANSSDQFDFLVSIDALHSLSPTYLKWGNYGPNTFVLLKKDADPEQFNKKIKDFLKTKGQTTHTLFIRPYADSYLYNHFENGVNAGGRIDDVKLFSLIAVFILVIACINFMNLSTAKASRRFKEVGIKKVMGANRTTLMIQYLVESMLLTFLGLFLSLLLVELLLPQFNALVDKELSLQWNLTLVLSLLGITTFTGLISGSYPAIYLSGLKPSAALKGNINLSTTALLARQGLVVFQFALSVILIVSVLVIYKQIAYLQTKNHGYKKENVLYFETEGKFSNNVSFVIDALKQMPGVVSVASINRELLGDLSYTFGDFSWEGRNPKEVIKFQRAQIDEGLIETLGIEMAAGRSFSSRFGSDTSKIIVNEAGIKVMRLKDPVGKIFSLYGRDLQIIGVVKDFHFESLHQSVKPMFLLYAPKDTNRIMVRFSTGKLTEVLTALKKFNATHNPGYSLDYKFLDDDFHAQYVAEARIALLSRYFAGLAIVISCLGLFGLATFTAEKRTKEIGIRKVLGASGLNIIYTLSKDFTRPVMAAILVALPLSYIMTKHWLDTFAYRIDLRFWFFIAAGVLALLLSLLTVFYQAYKASKMSPVQAIKTE